MPDSASRDDQELRHQHHRRHPGHGTGTTTMLPDRYEPFKRLAMIQVHPPPNPNKPLTPFSITDILNGRTRRPERRNGDTGAATGGAISALSPGSVHFPAANSRLFRSHVIRTRTPAPDAKAFLRPWDDVTSPSNSTSDDNDEEIEIDEEKPPQDKSVSPLDALFQMTSKTFDGRAADGSLQPGKCSGSMILDHNSDIMSPPHPRYPLPTFIMFLPLNGTAHSTLRLIYIYIYIYMTA